MCTYGCPYVFFFNTQMSKKNANQINYFWLKWKVKREIENERKGKKGKDNNFTN